jgi:Ca2+-binding EF-hand superfamily protein
MRVTIYLFSLLWLLPALSAVAQTFDILDLDGNGVLTLGELRAIAHDEDRLRQAFNRLDMDDNGVLSRSELGVDGRLLLGNADTDKDGVLTYEELRRFFLSQEAEPVLMEMDEDGDGYLQRHEYFKKKGEFKAGVWVPLVNF